MAYNIKRTNGDAILIQPGTVDGPANTQSGFTPETDLDLYGQGALNWGIGVDRNLVHLLENWAVASVPTTVVGGQQQYRPQKASEVGVIGAGINQPSIGQNWFNTTNGKMYTCYDIGDGTPDNALWKTTGADPDLFVPAAGGTFTGDVEIAKSIPTLQITSTDGTNIRLEMRDPNLKALLSVQQTGGIDTLILQKRIGPVIVNEMRMLDSHIQFNGGGAPAGSDAGKVRTPVTVDADPVNVVTTKGWVEGTFVNVTGDVMSGNLRIEKADPQFALDSVGSNVSNIFFDQDNVLKGNIQQFDDNAGNKYFGFRSFDGSATKTNEIRLYDDRIETFGQSGKIRTASTVVGDISTVLTTKDYVDAIATDLSTNYVLNTGDSVTGSYEFGPTNNNTVINNAVFTSTIASGNSTTIAGSTVQLVNGSGDTSIKLQMGPTIGNQASLAFFENGLNPVNRRVEMRLEQRDNLVEPDDFSIIRYAGDGVTERSRLSLTTGGVVLDGSDGTTATKFTLSGDTALMEVNRLAVTGPAGGNIDLRQADGVVGDFGIFFTEPYSGVDLQMAAVIYDDDLAIGAERLVLRRTDRDGSGNLQGIVDLSISPDRVASTVPITVPGGVIEDVACVPRYFRQGTAPSAASNSIPGDFWYNTSNNTMYVAHITVWRLVTTDNSGTAPVTVTRL